MKGKMTELFQKPEDSQCPFFQKECIKKDCMLYHKQFEKCEIEVLSYNTYLLSKAMQDMLKAMK